MKKIIFLALIGILIILIPSVNAGTWNRISNGTATPIVIGDCTLIDTLAEADSTHVYTLNPDHTSDLNSRYVSYWSRNARCDELQFHVDHSTSISRLNLWLDGVSKGWLDNIGSTHYNNQTVSTLNHEWFFIENGVARRIPDVLTGWSWGFLVEDRLSIYQTQYFYDNVTIGAPVDFNEGQYAEKIHSIWKDDDSDFSFLPARLAEQIQYYYDSTGITESGNLFERCNYGTTTPGNPMTILLDWSWMLNNSYCALGLY
ncbi:MAG: hypothetical protein ACNFW9_05095 [Candidatus Kerfeldbacteria bacterium]